MDARLLLEMCKLVKRITKNCKLIKIKYCVKGNMLALSSFYKDRYHLNAIRLLCNRLIQTTLVKRLGK